jgi:hypothetical protein
VPVKAVCLPLKKHANPLEAKPAVAPAPIAKPKAKPRQKK